MTKKTELENFMTKILKGEYVQRFNQGGWFHYDVNHQPLCTIMKLFREGHLRITPAKVISTERKIEKLRATLKVLNKE